MGKVRLDDGDMVSKNIFNLAESNWPQHTTLDESVVRAAEEAARRFGPQLQLFPTPESYEAAVDSVRRRESPLAAVILNSNWDGVDHKRDDNFDDYGLADDHVSGKIRRAMQFSQTFGFSEIVNVPLLGEVTRRYPSRHSWRRNEGEAYKVIDARREEDPPTGRPVPYSVGMGIPLDTLYHRLHDLFGPEVQRVLAKYTPQEALTLQSLLGKMRLHLPRLMDLGTVIRDVRSNTVYLYSGEVSELMEAAGIPQSQFSSIGYNGVFTYTKRGELVVVTLTQQKAVRHPQLEERNILYAGYRDDPFDGVISQFDKVELAQRRKELREQRN